MRIGMIGLGRMGANMVRRLVRGGHECVVFDRDRSTTPGAFASKALSAMRFEFGGHAERSPAA